MSAPATATPAIDGMTAEFLNPTELVNAAKRAREAGYRKLDAYSPMPIEELDEALALRRTRLPRIVLTCGLLGTCAGMGLEYWASAIEYPMNIGGRPFFTWPSFIPVAYEVTILFAALSAVIGMLALNGLPPSSTPRVLNAHRRTASSSASSPPTCSLIAPARRSS